MPRVERHITVSTPPGKVFGYVSDFSRHPEWAAHSLRIQQTSEGPIGVGATFTSVGHQLGRDNEDRVTVTELAPAEKIVYECEGGGGLIRHWIALRRESDGTALSKGIEPLTLRFPFSVLFPVLNVAGVIGRGLDADLQRIKAKLEEAQPAQAAAAETPPEPAETAESEAEEPEESA